MPIAGVIIQTDGKDNPQVLKHLQRYESIHTYGVYKGNAIVAVMDCPTTPELRRISEEIAEQIPGVMGVYPAYVNYEDQMDAIEQTE